ncbi:hypothetical protein H632_c253p0, partial [Helicosporidium sp. ATCC 50920]
MGASLAEERIDNDTRIYNCHVIVNNEGEIVDCYRKIHLFDVAIDNGPTLTESAFTKPGKETKTLETPAGKLGLSTCYDIRFPELYERLATQGGADIIAIPSAFTVPTGQAHWEILVRARAIETQCYVVAAAQGGVHNAKRETFGRSLIVDPWGQVIAELEDRIATGIAVATLHLERLFSVLAAPAPSSIAAPAPEYFITIKNGQFMQGCVPFYPAGWNQWETMEAAAGYPYLTGASLPANTTGPEFIRDLLASGVSSGLNTLRAWAYSVDPAAAVQTAPGVYNEDALFGLDYLLDEARKKGVRLILAFTSNWTPVGGPQEYARWANADPDTGFFVNPSAKAMFKNYIQMILQRVNKLNGRRYSEDPTIFALNLINEPRCAKCPPGTIASWTDEMAGFVKGLDANHLVTVGEDGFFGAGDFAKYNPGAPGNWAQLEGQDFLADHASVHIDFATFHAWVDNWQVPTLDFQRDWISSHVAAAKILKKPVILEEFGKWFDDAQPEQSMKDRKIFMADAYKQVNEQLKSNGPLKGALFWQFYAEGQRAPFSEGGTRGLYGIYPSDDVFQDIAANAKIANTLSVPQ